VGRVWAIAINTFREAVRDKVLYGVLGFAIGILLFTLALAELSLNQQQRVVLDVGLASISFFGVVIAIFLGSSLLYKEIDRKTLYIILPKPIRRWEFLLGKYVGIVLTAAVFIAIMGAIQLWVTAVQADAAPSLLIGVPLAVLALLGFALWRAKDRTAVLLPWSLVFLAACASLLPASEIALGPILSALLLSFGEVMVLSAVALLFSSFSTPFLTGAFSLGVWAVGRSADEMAAMNDEVVGDTIGPMLRGLSRVVPNFNLFVPGRHALSESSMLPNGLLEYLGTTMGYGLAYAALLFAVATLIFRRRDFL